MTSPAFSDSFKLGLGCSRLGSVSGTTGEEARNLLRIALDEGIRFFDTSNIYGQGDSERCLGEIIGNRTDCIVCTKGGKYLPFPKRLLVPAKNALRGLVRRSGSARSGIMRARARPMPVRWDAPFLAHAIDASLKRLRRERIDIYLLHSAPSETLQRGEAIGALDSARSAGKIGLLGVSVDDMSAAKAALDDDRIAVIQVPLHPGKSDYRIILERASEQGVAVIAREILGGTTAISGANNPASFAEQRIAAVVGDPLVTIALLGTTNENHLRIAADHARRASQGSRP